MATKKPEQTRAQKVQEMQNAQATLKVLRQDAARLAEAEDAKKREALQASTALARVHPSKRSDCPGAAALRRLVAEGEAIRAQRDANDIEHEGAAHAVGQIQTELGNLLYKELRAFLGDLAEAERGLAEKLAKLVPLYREVEQTWAEIAAEYKALAPALQDRLKDADSERGINRALDVYIRAAAPRAFPLPNISDVQALSPRPSGVAELLALLNQPRRAA